MNKQDVLEKICQTYFSDEMEKIADDNSMLNTALGLAGAGGAAYGAHQLYNVLREKRLRQIRAANARKALKLLGLLGAGSAAAGAAAIGIKNPEMAKKIIGDAKHYSTILKERMTPSYTSKTIAAIRKFRKM